MDQLKMPSMDSVARVKAALNSDQGALGPFMITSDPAYVEAAGYAGYDFVLLDMEHGPGTFENLQNLIRAANVAGVCPVVRVPRGMDIWIDRALDVGAGALLVPQIDTADQVRAAVSAAKYGLDNLCAMVDVNGLQIDGATRDVMPSEPLDKKFEAFNWNVIHVDGHDYDALLQAFADAAACKGKPTVLLLKTTKGKGVSFMENNVKWHGSAPNKEQYEQAVSEINAYIESL